MSDILNAESIFELDKELDVAVRIDNSMEPGSIQFKEYASVHQMFMVNILKCYERGFKNDGDIGDTFKEIDKNLVFSRLSSKNVVYDVIVDYALGMWSQDITGFMHFILERSSPNISKVLTIMNNELNYKNSPKLHGVKSIKELIDNDLAYLTKVIITSEENLAEGVYVGEDSYCKYIFEEDELASVDATLAVHLNNYLTSKRPLILKYADLNEDMVNFCRENKINYQDFNKVIVGSFCYAMCSKTYRVCRKYAEFITEMFAFWRNGIYG